MVLGNPCGIKPCAFSVLDLLRSQAISVRWSGVVEKPGEKA
jgi:hypothetical protein